jgi:hypothetical protein
MARGDGGDILRGGREVSGGYLMNAAHRRASASIPSVVHIVIVRIADVISDRAGIGPLADAESFTRVCKTVLSSGVNSCSLLQSDGCAYRSRY